MIAARSWSRQEIADSLDYAILKPTASIKDIVDGAIYATKHDLVSVCVASVNVEIAAEYHRNVSAVIGFPHGNTRPKIKMAEARQAIEDGAKELDVVINYGRFLDGDLAVLDADLTDLCTMAHKNYVIVKAILETCYYTPSQIKTACRWCMMANVDYVKTSTGFGHGPATVEAVQTMLSVTKHTQVQIKASGGIKCYADVAKFLNLGCGRIGASRFQELLDE